MAAGGTSSEIKIIRAICPRPATSDPWSPPILRPTRDNEAACNLYTSRKVRLWPQSESVKYSVAQPWRRAVRFRCLFLLLPTTPRRAPYFRKHSHLLFPKKPTKQSPISRAYRRPPRRSRAIKPAAVLASFPFRSRDDLAFRHPGPNSATRQAGTSPSGTGVSSGASRSATRQCRASASCSRRGTVSRTLPCS